MRSSEKRTNYLKKRNIFHRVGENRIMQSRKIPLYPNLISFGSNVRIAVNVLFVTHDVIDLMLNNKYSTNIFQEMVGCIEIEDNVFVGSNTVILYNVKIGENVIVAAGSLVNRDIPSGEVWGGVQAKKIGIFDDFVNSRKTADYNEKHKPTKQTCSKRLEELLWTKFYAERK